ncbi:hypothetical protein [Methylophilus sp. YYY-1]|uniref:hypothetical protein n=1 Tax=Methylophilus sp. YYY-1 TaxID=2682087 RepID=UPI0023B2D4B7|nr:hypothetical protein [Methylophilus sp. YYY-1]MDF0378623.1 hypothetical protein [Methylophilus sp. YYY-1]
MQPRTLKAEFLNALFGEDDLGVVVRTHIYIESSINTLLDLLIPFPSELPRLRYEQKLRLCCAMGMHKSLFAPLKELGDLRNAFAHKINAQLSAESVAKLLRSVSQDDRQAIIRTYSTTRRDADPTLPSEFSELEPKSQLIGFALWLNATLDVLQDDARQRRSA